MIARRPVFLPAMLILGYVFLYGPIVSLIVYSFNASRLVTVWAGFSTHSPWPPSASIMRS